MSSTSVDSSVRIVSVVLTSSPRCLCPITRRRTNRTDSGVSICVLVGRRDSLTGLLGVGARIGAASLSVVEGAPAAGGAGLDSAATLVAAGFVAEAGDEVVKPAEADPGLGSGVTLLELAEEDDEDEEDELETGSGGVGVATVAAGDDAAIFSCEICDVISPLGASSPSPTGEHRVVIGPHNGHTKLSDCNDKILRNITCG
jgi:hypothetical protein